MEKRFKYSLDDIRKNVKRDELGVRSQIRIVGIVFRNTEIISARVMNDGCNGKEFRNYGHDDELHVRVDAGVTHMSMRTFVLMLVGLEGTASMAGSPNKDCEKVVFELYSY